MAMLACARLGAIQSVVFGGFAPKELATHKPLLDGAIELASETPKHCVVLQREQHPSELVAGRDLDWQEVRAAGTPVDCEPLAPRPAIAD